MSETKNLNPPSLSTMEPTDKQLEVFGMLYPIFKDEVFRRRNQMMRLTAFASTILVLILIILLPLSSWATPTSPMRWFSISGVALFSGLFAFLILQHADRHQMAKQQVIELENALGLYQEGWKLSGEALFPENWQTDWNTDRSVALYLTILASLTILALSGIFVLG